MYVFRASALLPAVKAASGSPAQRAHRLWAGTVQRNQGKNTHDWDAWEAGCLAAASTQQLIQALDSGAQT